MASVRIVFNNTTTTEIRFPDAIFTTDGDLAVVLKNGERVFAVPVASVVALERIENPPAPVEEPGA